MGLRDFLTGAQQFKEGAQEYGKSGLELRKQALSQEFAPQYQSLLTQMRDGTPEEKQAASSKIQIALNAGIIDKADPFLAQALKGDDSKTKAYGVEALKLNEYTKGLPEKELYQLANSPRADQDSVIKSLQSKYLESGKKERQDSSQANQRTEKEKTSAQDFGNKYTAYAKEFDKGVGGIESQLAAFKAAPSQVEAVNLAIAIGKAAGLSGSTAEGEVDRQTFKTLETDAQKLENYWASNPGKPLDENTIAAYERLANSVVKASKEKRGSILKGYLATQVPAYSDRLFKDGKKHEVLKSVEKDLGVTFNKTDSGIEMIKSKRELGSSASSVIKAAENTKNKEVIDAINKKLSALKDGEDIGPDANKQLMDYIKSKAATK